MSLNIEPVTSLDDPRIADYQDVTDGELLSRRGLFMAEGRFILASIASGRSLYRLRSVLLSQRALEALRAELEAGDLGGAPVYVAPQAVLDSVAGFHVHRGALGAGERPETRSLADVLEALGPGPSTIVALEDLTNHDNVGAMFRNALALGASGVVLSPACCDPLYRKAIRVSMGASLRLPFARGAGWPDDLEKVRRAGFSIVALATGPDATTIERAASELAGVDRLALLLGAEGPGLSPGALEAADAVVRIPMAPGVDSLNVATAGAIALHRLTGRRPAE